MWATDFFSVSWENRQNKMMTPKHYTETGNSQKFWKILSASRLALAKIGKNGYYQSTCTSQNTTKWLLPVDWH